MKANNQKQQKGKNPKCIQLHTIRLLCHLKRPSDQMLSGLDDLSLSLSLSLSHADFCFAFSSDSFVSKFLIALGITQPQQFAHQDIPCQSHNILL